MLSPLSIRIIALDDESFYAYARQAGADENILSDFEHPSGILVNQISLKARGTTVQDNLLQLQAGESLPFQLTQYDTPDNSFKEVPLSIQVAAITGQVPPGGSSYQETSPAAVLYISDSLWNHLTETWGTGLFPESGYYSLYLDSNNPKALREEIDKSL